MVSPREDIFVREFLQYCVPPCPGHRAPPWGRGQAKAVGLQVGLAQQGSWPGQAGLWGAGDRPCWGMAGAGADSPGELTWGPGPWALGWVGESPGEAGQGESGW